MEEQYYIMVDGVQRGPISRDALRYQGIKPSTYVWRAGLRDWVQASQLPELADLFVEESAFGDYARSESGSQPPHPDYVRQDNTTQQPPRYGYGQNPYQQNPYQQNPYQQNPYDQFNGPAIPHFNWLPWAIVGTVCGLTFSCLGMIFGIIGITQANKANRYYGSGWKEQGDAANSSARTMTIISLVIAGIGLILAATGFTGNLLRQISGLG